MDGYDTYEFIIMLVLCLLNYISLQYSLSRGV